MEKVRVVLRRAQRSLPVVGSHGLFNWLFARHHGASYSEG